MVLWYKSYGFKANPLSVKPRVDLDLVGLDETREGVYNSVRKGELCFLYSDVGFGKSTFLQQLVNTFKGKYRIITVSCNRKDKALPIDQMLVKANGLSGKVFRRKAKNILLVIDEAQELYDYDQKKLLEYYYFGFFRCIVFAGTRMRFIPELREELERRTFELDVLNPRHALTLVRSRIGDRLLSDEAILHLYTFDQNPRGFLKNCEDACRHAHREGRTLSAEDIKLIFTS